jgi:hypothetical protein
MRHIQHLIWITITSAILLVGCGTKGPDSTQTDSTHFATLPEKVAFLEQYVPFQRHYESLGFSIFYQNNSGGMVPGPSYWDIRLTAVVPAEELDKWIPEEAEPFSGPTDWLDTIPGTIDCTMIDEWYRAGSRTIGLDRRRQIVAYQDHVN